MRPDTNPSRYLVPLIFLGLLLLGLTVFRDYGVGYDEGNNRFYGRLMLDYVLGVERPEFSDPGHYWHPVRGTFARTHGPLLEMLLGLPELLLGLEDPRDTLLLRHFLLYLLFWASAVVLYVLCRSTFGSWTWGLFGVAMLVASPRLFAKAFTDSMDLGFLFTVNLALLTLLRFVDRPTLKSTLLHALATAVAIDVRIAGCFLPVLSMGLLLVLGRRTPNSKTSTLLGPSLGYVLATWVLAVVLNPSWWQHPLTGPLLALESAAADPWPNWEWYLGAQVNGREVPWHFTAVWIGVTTPPLWLLLALLGLGSNLLALFRSPLRWLGERPALSIACLVLTGNLAAMALPGVTLFNGWRHLFYLYPSLLLLATAGGLVLIKNVRRYSALHRSLVRRAVILPWLLLLLQGGSVVYDLVRYHPLQNLYFNRLTGGLAGALGRFEIGYWATEYREALEYLLATYPGRIRYRQWDCQPAPAAGASYNERILRATDRERLEYAEWKPGEPEVFWLKNAFHHPDPPCSCASAWPHLPPVPPELHLEELWARRIDGIPVIAVYRERR